MIDLLAALEGGAALSIALKAATYGATLLAAGLALWLLGRPGVAPEAQPMRRLAVGAAALAAVLTIARLAMRASFLGGGGLEAAIDPMLLGFVIDSPLGDSSAVRGIGLLFIASLAFGPSARVVAAFGGAAALASFAAVGHTLDEPRALLGALLTLHLLAAAWWLGTFAPLRHLARIAPAEAGAASEEFGRAAVWVVAMLVVAGAALFVLLTGDVRASLSQPYGWIMMAKLVGFAALLGLGALNKLRLSPALAQDRPGAVSALRRSILIEMCVVAAILLVTAALTTLAAPDTGSQL